MKGMSSHTVDLAVYAESSSAI